MMIQEFEALTGIFPSAELYKAIEVEYMDGPWTDKQSFCAAYKKNKDGLAEMIAKRACDASYQEEKKARKMIEEAEKEANLWRIRYEKTQQELDKELGWTAYEDERRISEKDYKRLAAQTDTRILSEEEAKDLIFEEFGFAKERILIITERAALEIDKRHRLRSTHRMMRRDPLYNATDWNYIGFECSGYSYEMVNGELNRI